MKTTDKIKELVNKLENTDSKSEESRLREELDNLLTDALILIQKRVEEYAKRNSCGEYFQKEFQRLFFKDGDSLMWNNIHKLCFESLHNNVLYTSLWYSGEADYIGIRASAFDQLSGDDYISVLNTFERAGIKHAIRVTEQAIEFYTKTLCQLQEALKNIKTDPE